MEIFLDGESTDADMNLFLAHWRQLCFLPAGADWKFLQAIRMDSKQQGDFLPMGNEKGFILPFSMFLTFAILIFTMSAASIFVSRYSYLDTMEEGYHREAIILYSLSVLLVDEDEGSGLLRFNPGTVHYQKQTQEQVVALILSVEMDNKKYPTIRVTYDKETREIIGWE
jgi:hypothetical protein